MKKNIILSIAICSFINIKAQNNNGDSLKNKMLNLNEVEIEGTLNSQKRELEKPVSAVKLSELELKRGTGLFLDDAINANVPGVFMEKRTISAGQQFNIRGYGNGVRGTNGVNSNFDGQGSKIYLNGIPITDAEGITLMDDIDFGSIGNVEVIKGPAGSLYGLAIAGVVNLKTAKAPKGKVSIGQDYLTGSYGLQRATSHIQIGGENSSVHVNYGNQRVFGYMKHTLSQKQFVNFMGEFQPNKKQTINTYFGYSNSYEERNGEQTIGQYDTLNYSGSSTYITNNAHSNIISYRAGISHAYALTKNLSNTTSVFGSGITSNVSSAGGWTDKLPVNYGLRSTLDMNFKLSDKFNLSGLVGVELQRQDAQTIGYGMVKDSANPNGYWIIGAMTSNKYATSSTSSLFSQWILKMPYDISLTAGLGMSTMSIDLQDRFYVAKNNKPVTTIPMRYSAFYGDMFSPSIALNKVISKQLSVYVSYNKGYKAPVSSYFFIPTTGQVNTNLKPEIGTQFEIGTKGSLLKNKLTYQIAIFNAIFSNKMTTIAVPLNTVVTAYSYVANGGSQDNKGLEVLVKCTVVESNQGFIRSLKPFVNFTYSQFKYVDYKYQKLDVTGKNVIEVDYSGNPVAGVAPIVANAGIDLQTKFGFYFNVNYNYRDAMPFTSDNLNKTKSYSLLNSKIGIQQTVLKHLNVDLFFGANNMTNTQYYYMVFLNQLPDAYLPAPNKINYFGGINLKYTF